MPILQRDRPPLPAPSSTIRAHLSYLAAGSPPPVRYLYAPPAGAPRDTGSYEQREVEIHDGRAARRSLDHHGFELHDAPTRVADFHDDEAVTRRYYPEIAELACAVTGARHAYVFDHLVRRREPSRPLDGLGEGRVPDAAGRVHNDYTEASGHRRLGMVTLDATVTRFAILTLWRPILAAPVLDTPLAVCDARSVAARELVVGELHYRDRIGEIYLVTHSPAHRWSYVPGMVRDEVLVFKQYDSQAGVARFTPHAAFTHPDAALGHAPRQSIEARCLVTYD